MLHNATFHQGLHCLLKQFDLQRKEYIFGNYNLDPSIYTMDHTDFIVCSFMENSIGLKSVKEDVLFVCVNALHPRQKTFSRPFWNIYLSSWVEPY